MSKLFHCAWGSFSEEVRGKRRRHADASNSSQQQRASDGARERERKEGEKNITDAFLTKCRLHYKDAASAHKAPCSSSLATVVAFAARVLYSKRRFREARAESVMLNDLRRCSVLAT